MWISATSGTLGLAAGTFAWCERRVWPQHITGKAFLLTRARGHPGLVSSKLYLSAGTRAWLARRVGPRTGPARASVSVNSSIYKLARPAEEAKGLLGGCGEGGGGGGERTAPSRMIDLATA
jgi:hypothetical protein